MYINDLPNECIQLILRLIVLNQLIPLRAVCKRWQGVVESVCQAKKSLKLFGDPTNLDDYKKDIRKYNLFDESEFRLEKLNNKYENVLVVQGSADDQYWEFLASLFSGVTTLLFYVEPTDSIVPLLELWEADLTNLTIFYSFSKEPRDHVWAHLNTMPHLTRLHIFDLFACSLPADMEVLDQLEHLTLIRYERGLNKVLKQLGPKCSSLTLGSCQMIDKDFRRVEEDNPALLVNITRMRLANIFVNLSYDVPFDNCNKIMQYIGHNFVNLEFLDISYFRVALVDVIHDLARLTKLTTLQATIDRFTDFWNDHKAEEKYEKVHVPYIKTLLLSDDQTINGPSANGFYALMPSVLPGVRSIVLSSTETNRLNYLRDVTFVRMAIDYEDAIKVKYRLIQD